MWELVHKEGWVLKNQGFWIVLLEKTLKSPVDCKEIKSVHPKGNQPWRYTGKTDVKAEAPILWPPDAKRWLVGKDPDAGKDWRHKEKGTAEDEMVRQYHQLNGHESEQTRGIVKDREAWHATVHGIAKSHIWLSNWTITTAQRWQIHVLKSLGPLIPSLYYFPILASFLSTFSKGGFPLLMVMDYRVKMCFPLPSSRLEDSEEILTDLCLGPSQLAMMGYDQWWEMGIWCLIL